MWLLYSCPDIRFVSFRFFLLFSSPLPRCFLSAFLVPQPERNAIKITATKQIWLVVLGPCVPFVFPALSPHLPPPSPPLTAAMPCQRRHFAPVIRDVNKSFLHNFVKRILQLFFASTLFRSLSALPFCSLFATCLLYFALELLLLWLLFPFSPFPLRRETFLIMSRPWAKQGQAAPLKPRNSRTLRPK